MRYKSLLILSMAMAFGNQAFAGDPYYDDRGTPPSVGMPMRSEGSLFSFLFLARKTSSVIQHDDTRTDFREQVNTAPGRVGLVTGKQRVTIGGTTVRKEDEVRYSVTSSQDIDAAMGEVLTNAGIEYGAYEDVMINGGGPDPKVIQSAFATTDDMSAQVRSKVFSAARKCNVRYFAVGTIDIGLNDVDPVTGNKRVYVSVRAQLWDIYPMIPRKIGSVGPIQFSGLGPDQSVASRNALIIAAKETAITLTEQLNAKGVR
ncbi:MAG: hypothetical protein HGB00_07440 [Chlorobiaceae bacterium]|nr:hypothetical protein [Chlorobiaceae bacterium]